LIASGEEGYRTESKSADFDWLNNGVKGVSFAANISLPYIDFGTLHAYPGNWGFHYEDRMWLFENYIGDRCRLAARAMNGRGKPIVIEEIGYRKDFGNRDELLNEVFDYANSVGVAGTMVWRMTPRPTDDSHDYDFDFTDEGAAAVFKQAKILNAKSGGAHSPSLGSPGLRSEGLGSLKTPK
jgi:mannan endo-1,4-beta-mannosidase